MSDFGKENSLPRYPAEAFNAQPVYKSSERPPERNLMAILGLITSIIGIIFVPILTLPASLMGATFSIIGIKRSHSLRSGKGMAWVGLSLSIFALLCLGIIAFTVLALDGNYA